MNCILLVSLLLFYNTASSLLVNHCFTTPNSSLYYPYTVSTLNPFLNLIFTLTPSYTAALALLQTINITPSLNREDWIHFNSKTAINFDYEGLVTGRPQSAWISNPAIGTIVHIYVLNFQNSGSSCFNLSVGEQSSVANQCPTAYFYSTTNYCDSCSSSKCGVYCSITEHQMNKGDSTTLSLSPLSYSSFRFTPNNDIWIFISTLGGGVNLYFQQDLQFKELAGIVNYLASSSGEGSYVLADSQSYLRQFVNQNSSIALGIINKNAYSVTLTVSYLDQRGDRNLVIIIIVIGVVLLIGIVIAIIIIIKKIRQANAAVHSQMMIRLRMFNPDHSAKLTPADIELYFPSLTRSMIFPQPPTCKQQEEMIKKDKESGEFECVICLCTIEPSEEIKVAYCKHIFHANCLTAWLGKQQNCPYCRRDHQKTVTAGRYEKLVKESGDSVQKLELVRSLFRPKMNDTMENLEREQNPYARILVTQ